MSSLFEAPLEGQFILVAEGRGIASALIEASAQRARELGGELFTLHVYTGNARAQPVYERVGFEPDWLRMGRPLS